MTRRGEHELEVVRAEAADQAKRVLEESGELRPFAITFSGETDLLFHEVSESAEENPATAVEILAYGVRAGVGGATPRAVALVRPVVVRNLFGERDTSAVCVALEHMDGLARRWFLPYSGKGSDLTWGEARLVPGVPWFFQSGLEPDG